MIDPLPLTWSDYLDLLYRAHHPVDWAAEGWFD